MKTVGLIAEYNPFHNGHKYHMEEAKKLTNADYVVVVMSGDFTQRGCPAIMDKFVRAHMALAEGADLVIELPAVYATASAEYFALGAVSILDRLGCVDALVFGSESWDSCSFNQIAEFLVNEPEPYQAILKEKLSLGLSYPSARIQALQESCSVPKTELGMLLTEPNNILALEYLKALKKLDSSIAPFAIKRMGSYYYEEKITSAYSSATSIRKALLQNRIPLTALRSQIPENSFPIFCRALESISPISLDDFSGYGAYALLSHETELEDIFDIDPFLANRIRKNMEQYTSLSAFADLLKTKAYTHTRITRALCHLLLQIKTADMEYYINHGICSYARVLGFRKASSPLLSAIKKASSLPLITKPAKAYSLLDATALAMLNLDLYASRVYHSATKRGMAYDEYATPFLLLK